MKKTCKIIGVIVLTAIIGFSLTGCSDGGDGGNFIINDTNGKLTITGLNSFEGKYAIAVKESQTYPFLIAGSSLKSDGKVAGGKIGSDGSVTLKVWAQYNDYEADDFDRTASYSMLIGIFNTGSAIYVDYVNPIDYKDKNVSFTSGIGTVAW